MRSLSITLLVTIVLLYSFSASAHAGRPLVAYTGVYLMGNKQSEASLPLYARNKDKLRESLRVVMKKIDSQAILPFSLMFDSNMEDIKLTIDNTLSLAFLIVRDDIAAEQFTAGDTTVNKTIVNVGLVAILYDTRKIDGKDRNTIVFSFPLVGYAQRLDGSRKVSEGEIDGLFVETAVKTVNDHLVKRLATVAVEDIYGEVTTGSEGKATITLGAVKGLEEGQNIIFLAADHKSVSGPITRLEKESAVVELPKGFTAAPGMKVRTTNMRASSDETFQVVDVKVSSKKVATYFPPEIIGPQTAQWFSNFLTERSGKVVQPSRIGGSWDVLGTKMFLHRFDRQGGELWQVPVPGDAWAVNVTRNGLVLGAFGDGTIRWYRLADGKELLAFFPHADQKRWIMWTPEGYFDASPGGAELIGYHLNQGKDKEAKFIPISYLYH